MSRRRHRPHRVLITATCYDKRGRIISTSTNSYSQSHPYQAKLSRMFGMPDRIYLHAEIAAIIKARGRKIYKIFIERYDSLGNPKTACPCPACTEAIRLAGIERVEFTVG